MRFFPTLTLVVLFSVALAATRSKYLKNLHEENWKDVLSGEWMVEL